MGQLAAFATFMFLASSSVWATTTAPTAPAPGAPPAPAAGVAGSGWMDYWWIALIVIVAALAIWYFSRSRRNRTGL